MGRPVIKPVEVPSPMVLPQVNPAMVLPQVKPNVVLSNLDDFKNEALSEIYYNQNNQKTFPFTFTYNNKNYTIEKKTFQISSYEGFSDNNVLSYKYDIKSESNKIICTITESEYKSYLKKKADINNNSYYKNNLQQSNRKYWKQKENCNHQCHSNQICNDNGECVDNPSWVS